MKRRSPTLGLVVILILAQWLAQVANANTDNPATYVTLFNNTFEISNLADETTVRVDLTLQPSVKAIVPTLADVAIGERHDQSLKDLFAVRMETLPAGSKDVPAMLITVKPKSLQQGTYKLRIEVRPVTREAKDLNQAAAKQPATRKTAAMPAAQPAQSLDIQIKLPAVALKTTSKLIIHQVRNGFFDDDPPTLVLTGASQNARLTDVKIYQTYLSGSDNVSTSRRVDFAPVSEIVPNATNHSAITLVGTFPLGTSEGAALISAPQLEQPVDLSFEIHNRRAKWTILAMMILGVVLGFITRVWSKYRIELRQARLKALDAATILERELQNRPDAEFHNAVEPAFVALTAAIQNSRVAEVTNQITAANAALAAALSNLDQRRITARNQFETLTNLARKSASLPADVAAAASIGAAQLERARSQLELDDVAGATGTLRLLVPGLGRSLGPAASKWRSDVVSLLEMAEGISVFLPTKVGEGISVDSATLKTKLAEFVPTTEGSSVTEISSLFDSIRNGRELLTLFVTRLATQFSSSVSALKIQFDQPLPPAVDELFNEAEQVWKKLPELAERPEAGATELQQKLTSLKLHWFQKMTAQISGSNAELVKSTRENVQSLFTQDRYFDATIEVIKFLHAPEDTLLGETGAATATGEMAIFEEGISFFDWLRGRRSDTGVTMVTTVHERTIPPNLEALRAKTWKELALARALQFVIAGFAILAVGYVLFADEFIGTFKELMAVFVWAFGLNLSADELIESITSAKLTK